MKRTIAIKHRIKKTAKGEDHPTLVLIKPLEGPIQNIKLEDEDAEMDFLLGRYPLRFRKATSADKMSDFPEHHLMMEEFDEAEHGVVPDHHKKKVGKKTYVLAKVPDITIGLQAEDTVITALGGSGDYLAFAMSKKLEMLRGGTNVMRIAQRHIKDEREKQAPDQISELPPADEEEDSTEDSTQSRPKVNIWEDLDILLKLYEDRPGDFYPVTLKTRQVIGSGQLLRNREQVQKTRKAVAMQVRQLGIGEIFIREDGHFPEGSIAKELKTREASDDILSAIEQREGRYDRDLAAGIENVPIYKALFEGIEGVGPVIAGSIICAIGDIHRFVRTGGNLRHRAGKLKKFCGVAPQDGKLPRKTAGQTLGFNPHIRQALYKFGDQMVKRPGSTWGLRLAENKAHYLAKFPFETLVVKKGPHVGEYLIDGTACKKVAAKKYEIRIGDQWAKVIGKRKHFKGHQHKMAIWKTLTEFVEHLYDQWTRLEGIIPGQGDASEQQAA